MAETVGLVASAIGIAGLAGKIVKTSYYKVIFASVLATEMQKLAEDLRTQVQTVSKPHFSFDTPGSLEGIVALIILRESPCVVIHVCSTLGAGA
ncbi:hypothetical protein PG984_009763 [Apiospora sp. TS-2023a]